jgi:predicted ATPase/DNA-binding SARP family transcriptional activator
MERPERQPAGVAREQAGPDTTQDHHAPSLTIQLLGGFAVSIGGRPVPDAAWGLQKARSLVKLLALAPDGRLPRDQVLDRLWPDFAPGAAQNNLYSTLGVARKALAPAGLRLRGGLLVIEPPGPLLVDAARFEQLAAAARRSDDPADYEAALALYGGDLLPDDPYEEWTIGPRERLRDLFRGLLRAVAARYESRGDRPAALAALERLVAADRLDEAARAELMRLHALGGNRAGALRHYEALREALASELDAEPGREIRRLYGDIATGRFPPAQPAVAAPPAAPPAPATAAPALPVPLTRLIGRERELAEVRALLAPRDGGARLVTLTGIGGSGKTRLALAVAQGSGDDFPAGAHFVALAGLISDPGQLAPVAETVAATLGIREEVGRSTVAALIAALRPRPALLILDNCEQVIDAVAELVAALLAACPALRVLATSREALRLSGETAWPVPQLAVPDDDRTPPEALATYPSVALFVERVRGRRPDFALTPETAPAVVAICRRLAGLPLALELAAARSGVLSVGQIAARLDDALGTLASRERGLPQRQQSLRAALDWSYDLLSAGEQALFRRLAIFAGGCDLPAVEVIAGEGADDPLATLESLVDKSLVLVEPAGDEARYRLLEPVRQYAAARLAPDEARAAHERHAAFFAGLAAASAAALVGAEQAAWIARLRRDADNLRAALAWLRQSGAAEAGLRFCRDLYRFWVALIQHEEGRRWFATFLDLAGPDAHPGISPAVRAAALFTIGRFVFEQGDNEAAAGYARRALAVAERQGDRGAVALALTLLGHIQQRSGDYAAARSSHAAALAIREAGGAARDKALSLSGLGLAASAEGDAATARAYSTRAIALARAAGDLDLAARIGIDLGQAERAAGDLGAARGALEAALALARAGGYRLTMARSLNELADLAVEQREVRRARDILAEALALVREVGVLPDLVNSLDAAAALAAATGEARPALRLAAAAAAQAAQAGIARPPAAQAWRERALAPARAALGAAASAAWAAGQSLALDDALAEARAIATG